VDIYRWGGGLSRMCEGGGVVLLVDASPLIVFVKRRCSSTGCSRASPVRTISAALLAGYVSGLVLFFCVLRCSVHLWVAACGPRFLLFFPASFAFLFVAKDVFGQLKEFRKGLDAGDVSALPELHATAAGLKVQCVYRIMLPIPHDVLHALCRGSTTPCSIGMSHMGEYTCCSSVAFERPSENTLHFPVYLHSLPPSVFVEIAGARVRIGDWTALSIGP
jgi:hypothetical protein